MLSYISLVPARHGLASAYLRHILICALSALVVLPGVFGESAGGLPRRILGSRAMEGLGRISYGVFLWHQPLLMAFAREGMAGWIPGAPFLALSLVAAPALVACGVASYALVERPAMRLR